VNDQIAGFVCRVCLFVAMLGAVFLPPLVHAQTLATIYNFCPQTGCLDGDYPFAGLVQATNGDLYGTTNSGGVNGYGTVFRITPAGELTTLYSFCAQSACTDGANPQAGLVQATSGDLYGTTVAGGSNGQGTVFKITPNGALTTLHSFCALSDCSDGSGPMAALVQATNGDLYGTASTGGVNGGGTIFRLTPAGDMTTLYSFCAQSDCTDGDSPQAGLVQATNGDLYGTTTDGGEGNLGTVFRITLNGALTTQHSFCASGIMCTDGLFPASTLVQVGNNLYGTTTGDEAASYGTVFAIAPSGQLTTLYTFCAVDGCATGFSPNGRLVLATNGNLYGAAYGGPRDRGTIFEITLTGTLTTVASFCGSTGCADGFLPLGGLLQATNGDFYGTTDSGGADNKGTVFSLSIGLGPFVTTLPTSGKIGMTVKILGSNLTGASAVSFNGTPTTFTVNSASEIVAKVPTGATTGTVEVETPSGILTSNAAFRVRL